MKEATDFINAETGEVLATINNLFLEVATNESDINLATLIAVCLVDFDAPVENFNKPITVIAVRNYEDGTTLQATNTFYNLLNLPDIEPLTPEEEIEMCGGAEAYPCNY